MTRATRRRPRQGAGARRRAWRARLGALLSLTVLAMAATGAGLWFWSRAEGPLGESFELRVPPEPNVKELCRELALANALDDPWLFNVYLRVTNGDRKIQPGVHLLRRGLAPAALSARLSRSKARTTVKFTIPEGYNRFQVADRLQTADVAVEEEFLARSCDAQRLRELGIPAPCAEGYLFPATYELYVDSDADVILGTFAREATRRMASIMERHPQQVADLAARMGWGRHELLTLASIVEKEAADASEHGSVASVFYNRLNDPSFRPKQMLQSDPTAGYGCLVARGEIESCRGYNGIVTPGMLRDAANEYNTYKHAGLPPGPISNPGQSAILSVVDPPQTPYFFFVLGQSKRHVFSRTLSEHEQAIVTGRPAARDAKAATTHTAE